MKSLFSVTYYRRHEQIQEFVVASTLAEAASHLGVSQWISGYELLHNVEVPGVDKPHAKIEPTPTHILPLVPLFTSAELEQLGAHFTPAEIEKLQVELKKEPGYVYRHA